jgi:hypothetical protein
VATNGVRQRRALALRPCGHLFRQSTISILAFFAPLFAVLYWLTIPGGVWLPVAVGQAFALVLYGIAAIAFARTVIWVDHTGVSERGFFGRVAHVPVRTIGSIVMLELYQSDALDTHPQLFVTGSDGRLLLRMRGQFYSRQAMETVVHQLGTPVETVPEPLTLLELNRLRPELLYWFERRPVNRGV